MGTGLNYQLIFTDIRKQKHNKQLSKSKEEEEEK